MASSVGILNDEQVLDVLRRRRSGRLSCAADGFTRISAVRYHAVEGAELYVVVPPDPDCLALVRANPRVRLEVDDVQGPSQWETVLGWGRMEEVASAERAAGRNDKRPLYKIRLDALRGFYRAGSNTRHLD